MAVPTQQPSLLPEPQQELPPILPEQEARIRAFINMLLDRVEKEQANGIIRGNHD